MIERVTLHRVRMPLRAPFVTAHGTEDAKHATIVEVVTDAATGWGECVALRHPDYTSEYADEAFAVLRDYLVPAALGGVVPTIVGHPMAKAAMQHALLDAALKSSDLSLAAHLGATRDRVPAGVAIGLSDDLATTVDAACAYSEQGYRRVKLKIAPGRDVDRVVAVRAALPDIEIHVDANGAYSRESALRLAPLDELEVALIEQPLDPDDLEGHVQLASALRTPLCLDEAIVSERSARRAIDTGACRVVNLKPGRVGGIAEARRIHDLCVARGVGLWCGGMIETGIGRAVNVALAAMPGFTLTGDVSASGRFFERDLTDAFVLEDGMIRVPLGPGIGVRVDTEMLSRVTLHRFQRARQT